MKDMEKAKQLKKPRQGDKSAKIAGALFSIEFDDDLNNFKHLGTSYTRKIVGSEADAIEYMVCYPKLIVYFAFYNPL